MASDRRARWVLAALLAAAAALRLPGLLTDLWLDEIWSLLATRSMTSALDVFRTFRIDNNHHLNTLWLYLLGDRDLWQLYRLPSYAAGVGSVALAWLAVRRDGLAAAATAGALVAASYPMVVYSTEARGYAPAVCFCFAGWVLLQRFAAQPSWPAAAGFWAVSVLAVLSHLTALHFLVAAAAWFAFRLARERRGLRGLVLAAWAFGVPAVVLPAFYLLVVRGSGIGSGPAYRIGEIAVATLALAAGGPVPAAGAWPVTALAAALAAGTLLAGIALAARRGDDRWVFFAVVTVVSPAAVLVASRPPVLFPRYFLVSGAFGFLAAGGALAAGLTEGRSRRAAALILGAFLAGNLMRVATFARIGRGGYLAAVRLMERESLQGVISIGGDYFHVPMVLEYYRRFLPPSRKLLFRDFTNFPREGTEWYVTEHRNPDGSAPPEIIDPKGNRYRLREVYPCVELSGIPWLVYRREGAPPPPAGNAARMPIN